MAGPPELALFVGRRLRALRDAHGVTADTVAGHARRFGLGWQRSTVATLEAGRRRLTGEELLLLPLVLSAALPVSVSLRDLLDADIALTDELVMTANGFRQLLDESTGLYGGYRLTSTRGTSTGSPEQVLVIERLWPEVRTGSELDLRRVRAVEHASAGEAEQNLARALGRTPLELSAVAHRLWGRGLTAERDARMEAHAVHGETPAGARVRRGHVTRVLLEEVAAVLARAADASRPPPAHG